MGRQPEAGSMYNPHNHYWIVGGDQTQAFSSASNSFVATGEDGTYIAWKAAGNRPTAIDTLDNLKDVLTYADVPPYKPISQWQARKALRAAGLIDAVDAAVAASSPNIQDGWQYASIVVRTDPLIAQLAQQLNLSDAQVDSLFITAATL